MTHFAKFAFQLQLQKKIICLHACQAMASVNVCRLCTNVDKTINLFSRAGMRNE